MKVIEPIPDSLVNGLEQISADILHYHQHTKAIDNEFNVSSLTSFKYLDSVICNDVPVAAKEKYIEHINLSPKNKFILSKALQDLYPKCSITKGGFFIYPEGGYMGWHTNSNTPGKRIYLSHVEEGDKSFFRCISNGEKITSYDRPGWNMREFDVGLGNDPLWHCVNAEKTSRISLGFRVIPNLK